MLRFLSALVIAPLGAVGPNAADAADSEPYPVLVELFTSQGCSACPPADKLFAELAARDNVTALALHVDYWDYIGWEDSFAHPAFTERQKAYARAAGTTRVYTPEMVVAGQDRLKGYDAMPILDAIARHHGAETDVRLEAVRAPDDVIRIQLQAEGVLDPVVKVHLVRYAPRRSVKITEGENAGRSVTYHNVVTGWEMLTEWDGRAALTLTPQAAPDDPHVVIVQQTGHGPVLAVAELP